MFVKICGMTSHDAIDAAVEAEADAVGFVFTQSLRQLTPMAAKRLAERVPPGILRIAVARHPSPELCREVLDVLAPDCFQTDAEDFAYIDLPGGCEALPVYRNGHVTADAYAKPKLLFEGNISGSGETADWEEARRLAERTQLILAGGLDPNNVTEAIVRVRPWGVDVSSGVESTPGVKDPSKIKKFVQRAKAAQH